MSLYARDTCVEARNRLEACLVLQNVMSVPPLQVPNQMDGKDREKMRERFDLRECYTVETKTA